MEMIVVCLVVLSILFWIASRERAKRKAKQVEADRIRSLPTFQRQKEERRIAAERAEAAHGPINPEMVCPHCQVKGKVRAKRVDRKAGVSGTKASAAVLTGGASVIVTGLSQSEEVTEAACDNCQSRWSF